MLKSAMGKLHALFVGVDSYDTDLGLQALTTCTNDAAEVKKCFLDVFQLNADKDCLGLLTSKTTPTPSKGAIIGALQKLANAAGPTDRLLFYFSGHGQRINIDGKNQFFLVPQDAYSATDPEALISWEKVTAILDTTQARQKIIILDACYSGISTKNLKILPAKLSRGELLKYVRASAGAVFLSSSPDNSTSSTLSPDPRLSLFTYCLVRALRGDQRALDDDHMLTVNSLFEYLSMEVPSKAKLNGDQQRPVKSEDEVTGVFLLGDFSTSIINPSSIDLDAYPITEVAFQDYEHTHITNILTKITNFTYSEEYLARRANDALGDALAQDLGAVVSKLRRGMGFAQGTVSKEGSSVSFPGGSYDINYEADGKKTGRLIHRVSFRSEWFGRPDDMIKILSILDITPRKLIMELSKPIEPIDSIAAMESRGWVITSELEERVEAHAGQKTVTLETASITITGFSPSEVFGSSPKKDSVNLLNGVFSSLLLGP